MNSVPLPAKRPVFLNWLGLMLLAFVLAGCGRDNVKVYRLSNDDSSSAAPPPNATATPLPTKRITIRHNPSCSGRCRRVGPKSRPAK